jgi:hypothetical protein
VASWSAVDVEEVEVADVAEADVDAEEAAVVDEDGYRAARIELGSTVDVVWLGLPNSVPISCN